MKEKYGCSFGSVIVRNSELMQELNVAYLAGLKTKC